ncbi:uncharacterized protein LOC105913849 [Setaria italica]|uniref:uncharacterized protein LOC105913849 n=1 Tax=Setaria italica TaxID=4555 RepID=UPI0006491E0C|nr:uncharacterized protein LOC105913849 [Setaria italica]
MAPTHTASEAWHTIKDEYHNNALTRAAYLEVEFHTLQQSDQSITQYCSRLKILADNLRDIGKTISEVDRVLNMICGVNPNFSTSIPSITSGKIAPTFADTRSFLLEEHRLEMEARMVAAHTMFAVNSMGVAGVAAGNSGSDSNSTPAAPARSSQRRRRPVAHRRPSLAAGPPPLRSSRLWASIPGPGCSRPGPAIGAALAPACWAPAQSQRPAGLRGPWFKLESGRAARFVSRGKPMGSGHPTRRTEQCCHCFHRRHLRLVLQHRRFFTYDQLLWIYTARR